MAARYRHRATPLAFALTYAVFGTAYILLSDRLLALVAGSYSNYQELQTAKGWAFIFLTSVVLWLMLRRAWARVGRVAEAALAAEDRLRMALTAAGGLVWQARTAAKDGQVHLWITGGLARSLDLSETRPVGADALMARVHPADRAAFAAWDRKVAAGKVPPDLICRLQRVLAGYAWVKIIADPESRARMPDQTLFGVAFDITGQQEVAQDLAEVIDGGELGTWRFDLSTGRNLINDRWAELIGYTRDELGPITLQLWQDLVHPEDLAQLDARHAALFADRNFIFSDEIRLRHKDGHWVWILSRGRAVDFTSTGDPLILSGVHVDISRRKALEEELQAERDFLLRLTETSISGILALNERGEVLFANKEAESILGVSAAQMTGRGQDAPLWQATKAGGPALTPFDLPFASVLTEKVTLRDHRVVFRHPDGRKRCLSVNAAPTTSREGKVQVVCAVTDITAQLAAEDRLRDTAAEAQNAALHDSMTGLPNRALFEDHLNAAIARARAQGASLLHVFLDIDNFKQVNDRFGHQMGDLLIRKVAERLETLRQGFQVLTRVAGDEFTFLHPCTPGEDTAPLLATLTGAFEAPFDLEGRSVYVTVSVGVSVYPQDATTTDALWRHADLAMYEAKALGRNQAVRFSTELSARQRQEGQIAQCLQRALKNRAFRLVLQPKVALENPARVIGAEVLLRCTDPDLRRIGPSEFLPVAERTGLVRSIDLLVVDLVGEIVAGLRARGLVLRLSINLSPDSLRQAHFGTALLDHLTAAQLGPGDVLFELTEGALIDLTTPARDTIGLLHEQGYELSADDFGTGYSSLSYLHLLRLQELKIDRSFIQRLGAPVERSDEIVRAILAMGQALGLRMVAEGIETPEQVDWLRQNGCAFGQGYLFGPGVEWQVFADRHMALPAPV